MGPLKGFHPYLLIGGLFPDKFVQGNDNKNTSKEKNYRGKHGRVF